MFLNNQLQNVYATLVDMLGIIYSKNESSSIAKILLERIGYSTLDLVTSRDEEISLPNIRFLENALERLQHHEPVQYILGKTTFYEMELKVDPSVLIPRQETEELVDLIIKENELREPRILDVGTGSGCIAMALKKNIEAARVEALDMSGDALKVAEENARLNHLPINFYQMDILHKALLPGQYNIIVSNPPYVTESEKNEIMGNVLWHEPHMALFVPNESPLIFYECIIELALQYLLPNGRLYFEINETLGQKVKRLLQEAKFRQTRIIRDLNQKDRFITASRPG